MLQGCPGCRSSLIGDPGEHFRAEGPDFHKKEKEAKRKNRRKGRPVETAQPWKSIKVAFGNFCLMISTAA